MSRLIRESDVQDMLDDAQCISDGEYSYVCTEDIKLSKLPTVDAVPVVHGYDTSGGMSLFRCSVCGWFCWDTYCGDTDTYNYCPNYGAKMDGKKEQKSDNCDQARS